MATLAGSPRLARSSSPVVRLGVSLAVESRWMVFVVWLSFRLGVWLEASLVIGTLTSMSLGSVVRRRLWSAVEIEIETLPSERLLTTV